MRHVSLLQRGLGEAARSKMLERPLIPRYVSLPSTSSSKLSVGITAFTSSAVPTSLALSAATLSPFTASAFEERSRSIGNVASNVALGAPQRKGKFNGVSIEPRLPPAPISAWSSHLPDPITRPSESKLLSLVNVFDFPTSPLRPYRYDAPPSANPPSAKAGKAPEDPPPLSGIMRLRYLMVKRIKEKHTSLTHSQAVFLAKVQFRLQQARSLLASDLVNWYEDFVWTCERQHQNRLGGRSSEPGLATLESPQSLALMLKMAYKKADVQSIRRLEERARRRSLPLRTGSPNHFTSSQAQVKPRVTRTENDHEPLTLVFNQKIALAARNQNWIVVNQLFDDAMQRASGRRPTRRDLSRSDSALPSTKGEEAEMLNDLGWFYLIKHGFGPVGRNDPSAPACQSMDESISSDDVSNGTKAASSRGVQEHLEGQDDQAALAAGEERETKEKDQEKQDEAKLLVKQRLLPSLLRHAQAQLYGNGGDPTPERDDLPASGSEERAPSWLLASVLSQLADRGDTKQVLRLVRLARAELRSEQQGSALLGIRNKTTLLLDSVLRSAANDKSIGLEESLRLFAEFTGKDLSICFGPKPVAQRSETTKNDHDRRQKIEDRVPLLPSEYTLHWILKQVRNPVFRSTLSWKLYKTFRELFPDVKLTRHTFRHLISKCHYTASPRKLPAQQDRAQAGKNTATDRTSTSIGKDSIDPSDQANSTRSRPVVKESILEKSLEDYISYQNRQGPFWDQDEYSKIAFLNALKEVSTLLRMRRSHHEERIKLEGEEKGPKFRRHHTQAIESIERLLTLVKQARPLQRMKGSQQERSNVANKNIAS